MNWTAADFWASTWAHLTNSSSTFGWQSQMRFVLLPHLRPHKYQRRCTDTLKYLYKSSEMAYLQRMLAEFELTPVIAAEISRTHHLMVATMYGSKRHKLHLCAFIKEISMSMCACVCWAMLPEKYKCKLNLSNISNKMANSS